MTQYAQEYVHTCIHAKQMLQLIMCITLGKNRHTICLSQCLSLSHTHTHTHTQREKERERETYTHTHSHTHTHTLTDADSVISAFLSSSVVRFLLLRVPLIVWPYIVKAMKTFLLWGDFCWHEAHD